MNAEQNKPARRSPGEVLKDAVLFLAAPFITLAYLVLFPFIGLVMLARAMREGRGRQSTSQ